MDRWVWELLCYNFAAGSFHTENFVADYSIEVEFNFFKIKNRCLHHLL